MRNTTSLLPSPALGMLLILIGCCSTFIHPIEGQEI